MEVAASVCGLILAASTVYRTIRTYGNAPDIAKEILAQVDDFRYALKRLNPMIVGRSEISPLGARATDATQLAVTLASCTLTFSQLERIIDGLTTKRAKSLAASSLTLGGGDIEMSVYDRLRWTWENSNLTILVKRIQQHKLTLTLLLTIWMSDSSAEAEVLVDNLNATLESLTVLTKALSPLVSPPVSPVDLEPSSSNFEHPPAHLGTTTEVQSSDKISIMSVGSQMSFTSVLRNSRPYRKRDTLMPSSFSLATSQRRGTQWSTFSIGSNTSVFSLPFVDFQLSDKPLAEEPMIHKILIPMKRNLLYNKVHYPDSDWLELFKDSSSELDWESSWYLDRLVQLDDPDLLEDMIPNWTTISYVNLIMRARVHYGTVKLLNTLIQKYPNVRHISFPDGLPRLHDAVCGDNEVTLRALLAAGADRKKPNKQGMTPLEYAEMLGRERMIAILNEESEEVDPPV